MQNQTKTVSSFNKDKSIGNNGETAVSFLIRSMPDWKCIKFGVENHMEDLKETVRETLNPVTKKIKCMPDFVAFNAKTQETLFIEVKYRSNQRKGKYHFRYLTQYNEYWPGTKLIIVRPDEPYFIYIDLDKINLKMKKLSEINPGEWREYWNFKDIEQNIKTLFPDLSDEAIKTAIEMIPRKMEISEIEEKLEEIKKRAKKIIVTNKELKKDQRDYSKRLQKLANKIKKMRREAG